MLRSPVSHHFCVQYNNCTCKGRCLIRSGKGENNVSRSFMICFTFKNLQYKFNPEKGIIQNQFIQNTWCFNWGKKHVKCDLLFCFIINS